MAVRGKSVFKLGLAIGLAALAVVLIAHFIGRYPLTLSGVVVTDAPDPTKELPIADVEVTLTGAFGSHSVHSDASGFFNMAMQPPLPLTQPIMLHFRHPDYLPLDMQDVGDKLYIAHLTPRAHAATDQRSEAAIAHVVAQYFVNATTKEHIGSAV